MAVTNDALPIISAVVSGGFVLAGVIYTQRSGAKLTTDQTAITILMGLLDPIQDRLSNVEEDLRTQRTWRRHAVTYIRTLVRTHQDPPEPPAGFHIEEG